MHNVPGAIVRADPPLASDGAAGDGAQQNL